MSMGSAYMGGSLGRSTAQDLCNANFAGGAGCSKRDDAWKLFGGYQLSSTFSAELGYTRLGKFGIPGGSVKADAWEVSALGMVPVGPVSLYGRLGAFRAELECKGCAPDIKEKSTDWTYGAGVQFDVTPSVAVRGEWQRYRNIGGGRFNANTDIDVLSIAALYRFK